ncbi:MAG: hypothetical protein KatS3mg004_0392 [Bryobacteraceae bacterium]|nr:MAG: hypothetical protein KatS3mg004_0392 [Bryobacteraceae bacterium]
MHWATVLTPLVLVYVWRDASLLRFARLKGVDGAVWISFTLGLASVLGWIAEHISGEQAYALLTEKAVWIGVLTWHLLAWGGLVWDRDRGKIPLLALLAPSPMQAFAIGGFIWLLLQRLEGVEGVWAGVAVGAIWCVAAVTLQPFTAKQEQQARRIASAAQWTAILLLPMQVRAQPGLATAQMEKTPLAPLGVVAGTIAASFLVARIRRIRHDASL